MGETHMESPETKIHVGIRPAARTGEVAPPPAGATLRRYMA